MTARDLTEHEASERQSVRWSEKPFPACCIHCPSHRLGEGSCGHAQQELLCYYFALHPNASCPVFGEADVEPSEAHPIAKAIAAGYRHEERFEADFGLDPRVLVVPEN